MADDSGRPGAPREPLPDVSRLSVAQLYEVLDLARDELVRHAAEFGVVHSSRPPPSDVSELLRDGPEGILGQAVVEGIGAAGQRSGEASIGHTDDGAYASSVERSSGLASDDELRRNAVARSLALKALCGQALQQLVELPGVRRAEGRARLLIDLNHPLEAVWPSGRLMCLETLRTWGLADVTQDPSPHSVGIAMDLVEDFLISVFVYDIRGAVDLLAAGQRLAKYLAKLFAVLCVSRMERPRDRRQYEEMVVAHYLRYSTPQRSALHLAYLNVIVEEDDRRGTLAQLGRKRARV